MSIDSKKLYFNRVHNVSDTYKIFNNEKNLEFIIDNFDDLKISIDTYYYFDKIKKTKNNISLIKLSMRDIEKFQNIINSINILAKKYFGNNISIKYETLFIKIPHDGKYSFNKPIYSQYDNKTLRHPIELSSIKNILKNYAKNMKIILSCMTIKKKGILFDKYDNDKNKEITIDINEYVNFNFSISSIEINNSQEITNILKNIDVNYNKYLNDNNQKLLISINNSKNSKKNITNKILECVS